MPPRIVHLPLALAAGDVELAICPASELSRDASPNPSSVNDLRLARQQFSYFVSARVSYSRKAEDEYKFCQVETDNGGGSRSPLRGARGCARASPTGLLSHMTH